MQNEAVKKEAIGEVVESATGLLIAEVPKGRAAPAFGAWVQVPYADGAVIYGVVGGVTEGSMMPGRRATALGKTSDELQREMPHVLNLLRSSFHVHILAYRDTTGEMHQTLPPHSARIHDFVVQGVASEINRIGAPYDYLRTLMGMTESGIPVDDLLVHVLRHVQKNDESGQNEALIQAGRVLSRLMRDDHERLQAIFRRI